MILPYSRQFIKVVISFNHSLADSVSSRHVLKKEKRRKKEK
jgi:hypothetical protein